MLVGTSQIEFNLSSQCIYARFLSFEFDIRLFDLNEMILTAIFREKLVGILPILFLCVNLFLFSDAKKLLQLDIAPRVDW